MPSEWIGLPKVDLHAQIRQKSIFQTGLQLTRTIPHKDFLSEYFSEETDPEFQMTITLEIIK